VAAAAASKGIIPKLGDLPVEEAVSAIPDMNLFHQLVEEGSTDAVNWITPANLDQASDLISKVEDSSDLWTGQGFHDRLGELMDYRIHNKYPDQEDFFNEAGWSGLQDRDSTDAIFYLPKDMHHLPNNLTLRYDQRERAAVNLIDRNLSEADQRAIWEKYGNYQNLVDQLKGGAIPEEELNYFRPEIRQQLTHHADPYKVSRELNKDFVRGKDKYGREIRGEDIPYTDSDGFGWEDSYAYATPENDALSFGWQDISDRNLDIDGSNMGMSNIDRYPALSEANKVRLHDLSLRKQQIDLNTTRDELGYIPEKGPYQSEYKPITEFEEGTTFDINPSPKLEDLSYIDSKSPNVPEEYMQPELIRRETTWDRGADYTREPPLSLHPDRDPARNADWEIIGLNLSNGLSVDQIRDNIERNLPNSLDWIGKPDGLKMLEELMDYDESGISIHRMDKFLRQYQEQYPHDPYGFGIDELSTKRYKEDLKKNPWVIIDDMSVPPDLGKPKPTAKDKASNKWDVDPDDIIKGLAGASATAGLALGSDDSEAGSGK
jgi:hypothetical protein